MGQKEGSCYAPFAGGMGPRLTHCSRGRDLFSYQVASSSIQPFGHSRHGSKTRGLSPSYGEAATPPNTTSPGPRFTSVPSGILAHPAVWPQRTLAENWGGLCPFRGGVDGSPSYTMSPRLRPTSVPSGILIHTAVWPQWTWAENRGLCPLFFLGGGAGSPSNSWAEAHLNAKCHLDPSSRLATIDMGQNGGLRPFLGRGIWVPI